MVLLFFLSRQVRALQDMLAVQSIKQGMGPAKDKNVASGAPGAKPLACNGQTLKGLLFNGWRSAARCIACQNALAEPGARLLEVEEKAQWLALSNRTMFYRNSHAKKPVHQGCIATILTQMRYMQEFTVQLPAPLPAPLPGRLGVWGWLCLAAGQRCVQWVACTSVPVPLPALRPAALPLRTAPSRVAG